MESRSLSLEQRQTMRLTIYDNPQTFLDCVAPQLERREAENNVILGIANRLIRSPGRFPQPAFLATVEDGGEPLLVALRTPPHRLVISAEEDDPAEAVKTLIRHLADAGEALPGVMGTSALAEAFARRWARRTGQPQRIAMRERVFELRRVIPPAAVPGRLRLAAPADEELLVEWFYGFEMDAFGAADRAVAQKLARLLVADGDLYVWDDGGPVSMAATGRRTRRGAAIGYVYTPPELRRRGYASAGVAAVSQEMLDAGYAFCTLFTDLANATSNKIYQAIGYRPLADFLQIDFLA
ncbi:MAG TPA: GNAT family N-acetyltransferase [Anaerolineaceae bacterium]|nr:GNAT family N-acetyltransferase [Anaerolineaceae bacterium]